MLQKTQGPQQFFIISGKIRGHKRYWDGLVWSDARFDAVEYTIERVADGQMKSLRSLYPAVQSRVEDVSCTQ